MPPNYPSTFTPSQLQARACQWVGISLISLFLINLISSFLPPQLLNPDWQLKLVGTLIDNGAYPLLGLLLVLLASSQNPDDPSLQKRQLRWRALACWVSLAYLLLIPLIGMACYLGLNQASNILRRENLSAQQTIVVLRGVIQQSKSMPELQARLRQTQAPTLPPDATSIPLGDLKSQLLRSLQVNETNLKNNLRQPIYNRFLPLLQRAWRNMLSSVVLAVGFAAVALPRGSSRSQLMGWATSLNRFNHLGSEWLSMGRAWSETSRKRRDTAKRMQKHLDSRREAEREPSGKSSKKLWP
jgi:hypothetical protein